MNTKKLVLLLIAAFALNDAAAESPVVTKRVNKCAVSPDAEGCTPAVTKLPVDKCAVSPDAEGCTPAVTKLPVDKCAVSPEAEGCSPALTEPPVDACTVSPDAPGCSAAAIKPADHDMYSKNQDLFESCANYAHSAVHQQLTNARRHCGQTGIRWNNDYWAHHKWCQASSLVQRHWETDERAKALARCPKSFCEQYAEKAVQANYENGLGRCGNTGSRWSTNFDNHFDWCEAVEPSLAHAEENARSAAIESCAAR
jgi:hypothetical protein